MDVDAPPSRRHRRHAAVGRDTPNGGHRRKASPVDGGGANRHPQRTGRSSIDAGASDVDPPPHGTGRRIHLHERHATTGDPESVAEEREALRRRVALERSRVVLGRSSLRRCGRSCCHGASRPTLATRGRPCRPARLRRRCRATTLPDDGETRRIAAPWSSASQTGSCADPDVVRRSRAELDALRNARLVWVDAVEGGARVERPHGAEADGNRDYPPVEAERRRLAAGGKAQPHDARLLLARNPRGPVPEGPASWSASTDLARRGRNSVRLWDPPGSATRRRRGKCDADDDREESCELHPCLQKVSTRSHYFTDELALRPAYDPGMPEVLGRHDADLLQELYSTGLLVGLLVEEELRGQLFPTSSSRSSAG